MKETIIESRTLRDVAIERLEVLDKVKQVMTIPRTDLLTTPQVAQYFGVQNATIRMVYKRNKEEIDSDGVMRFTLAELRNHLETSQDVTPQIERVGKGPYHMTIDGTTVQVNPANNTLFTKRAVLRIAMLLRDSEIAKEIRTQLLNVAEVVEDNTPVAMTSTLDEEMQLTTNITAAFKDGDIVRLLKCAAELNNFQKARINKLQTVNHQLAGDILEWDNAGKINAAVRYIAGHAGMNIANVWTLFYRQLNYKYHINLKHRGGRKTPYLQYAKDDEWILIQKTILSIAENLDIDMEDMMNRSQLTDVVEATAREVQE